MDDDSFTLLTAVLQSICSALTQSQREAIGAALLRHASALNETAQDERSQLAALSLTALASIAQGDQAAADAVLRAPKRIQGE